jgi:site-specific DNA-methyltransferase (adenine-specific)
MSGTQELKHSNLLFKEIHNQQIILGDCLEIIKSIQDSIIDLVITSPPYNLGVKYNEYNDNKGESEYLNWLHTIFLQIKRVLRDDGSIFLNIGASNTKPWIPFDVAQRLRGLFTLQNRFMWVKSISIDERTYGHFKPINSQRYTNHNFEDIFHFTKNGDVKLNRIAVGVPYMDKNNLNRKKDSLDLRCQGNCWYIPYETIQAKNQKGGHPAIFPRALVERCIKLHGYNKDTIACDPFLGAGTTLVVTKKLGIRGIGIELDEKYYDYSSERLQNTKKDSAKALHQ